METARDVHAFLWRDPGANNCNTYLVRGEVPLLVDPGHGTYLRRVEQELSALGISLSEVGLVILTHGHPDHLEGAAAFARLPGRVAMAEEEAAALGPFQEAFYRAQGTSPPELGFDFFLREGALTVGEHRFQVLHTPGHSPGSICLYWPARKVLFTGDVLFREGLGRTDLPGGDGRLLKESIGRLESLEVEWMLPGHGDPIRGTEEYRRNLERVKQAYFPYI